MRNGYLLEFDNMKTGVANATAESATAAGARISMENADRVAIIMQVGVGTGADIKAILQQHIGAAGASKPLAIQNNYYVKAGTATKFTKVEPSTEESTIEVGALDAVAGLAVFEVLASDLDVNAGYTHISASVGATGSATKLVGVLYQTRMNRNCPPYLQDI